MKITLDARGAPTEIDLESTVLHLSALSTSRMSSRPDHFPQLHQQDICVATPWWPATAT